ncbi:hypothetical protein [Micromonospora echinaurantiaca]|uniref:hypothetical protein n=1 Tax=Micromonospora echinaurantiaca TaxID=47857 RepID=UPI00379CEB33
MSWFVDKTDAQPLVHGGLRVRGLGSSDRAAQIADSVDKVADLLLGEPGLLSSTLLFGLVAGLSGGAFGGCLRDPLGY